MYETYFGLERAPFTLSPDPRFLYAAPRTREAFAGVLHGVLDRRGFVVLTGESGTGKSTLLRAVLGEIPAGRLASSLIFNPLMKADEFLELAMLDFGFTNIPNSKAQRLARLQDFLLENHRLGRINVLFVDEAHTLTPELLEEVRLLTNFESADTKLLQIVLSGHSELDEVLERYDLRQLKQRIAIRVGLRPLQSPNEVGLYMLHRWRKAGASQDLAFLPGAISAIAHYSQGIPRTINSLCDNGLLLAYGAGRKAVDRSMVIDVARDLRLQPAPAVPAGAAARSMPGMLSSAGGVMQAGLPLPLQTGMQIRQPGIGSMHGQQPAPAIVLPLRPNEQPFAPIGSPAPFIPVDEELFTAADLNPADSGETAGSGKPVPANGTTAEPVAVSGDGSVPDENTTPVLSYGSGATTGGSVIGQWASRFRKATPKT